MKTLETLESRRFFAVTATVSQGALVVFGDAQPNGISVNVANGNVRVAEYQGTAGYQLIKQVAANSVSSLRIYGYDGTDTITVYGSCKLPATIMGGRGNDWIKSGGGRSVVWGHGDWEADISGSHRPSTDDNAADTLTNGTGSATLRGGGGDDTLIFDSSYKPSESDGGSGDAGNDTFHLKGTSQMSLDGWTGNDRFFVYASNPTAAIRGSSGNDIVDYQHFGQAVTAANNFSASGPLNDPTARKQRIEDTVEGLAGTDFGDLLSVRGATPNASGRGGNDTLFGGSGREVFDAGTGNDLVLASGGNDTVVGQDGNDTVYGGDGNDIINGGRGDDIVQGEGGNDTLLGDDGNDSLYAGSGTNLLVGGRDSDFLFSMNGSWFDTLVGDRVGHTDSGFDIAGIDTNFINGQLRRDLTSGIEYIA